MFCRELWTRTTTGHRTTTPISATAGPTHTRGRSEPTLSRMTLPLPLLLLRGALQRAEHARRVAGHRRPDLVLDLRLHLCPGGVRRVLDRARKRLDERAVELAALKRPGRCGRRRQQVVLVVELQLVLRLVGEIEELLDLRGVAARLERGDVVAHAERLGERAVLAGDRHRRPVGGLQHAGLLDDRHERGRAVDHPDLALGELLPQRGAVLRPRVRLGVAGGDEPLEELERLDVLRTVDRVLALRVLVPAAVAEEPQERLRLGLLGAERQTEANLAE